MISLTGAPKEWKVPKRRWQCPHCGTEGWSKDGQLPADHDRPDGYVCWAARAGAAP